MENTKIIVGNRFDALVKALNHSIPSFAKVLGYERCDKLYNIQKGKYYPSFEILQDITKNFVDVSTDWIISGRGSMFRSIERIDNNSQTISGNNNIQTGNNSKVDAQLSRSESLETLLSQIQEKNRLLKEKDMRIQEKDAQIKEKDTQINKLLTILSK